MTRVEAAAIRRYLQQTFGVRHLDITQSEPDKPALVRIGGQFVDTVHCDEDDEELSYVLTVPILAEDLVG